MSNPFTVSLVNWHDGEPLLKSIRDTVFIREGGASPELEWDGKDASCRHALALSLQGDAIGCGRMMPDGHIGHIAVLQQWRKQKVGTAIVEALLEYARTHDYPQISVDAQPKYIPFYRNNGFVEQGEAFMDAGVQRVKMALKLK